MFLDNLNSSIHPAANNQGKVKLLNSVTTVWEQA